MTEQVLDVDIEKTIIFTVLADNIRIKAEELETKPNDCLLIMIPESYSCEMVDYLYESLQVMYPNRKIVIVPKVGLQFLSKEKLLEIRKTIDKALGDIE